MPLNGGVSRARIPPSWQLRVWVNDTVGFWRFDVKRGTRGRNLRKALAKETGAPLEDIRLRLGCGDIGDDDTAESVDLFSRRQQLKVEFVSPDNMELGDEPLPFPEATKEASASSNQENLPDRASRASRTSVDIDRSSSDTDRSESRRPAGALGSNGVRRRSQQGREEDQEQECTALVCSSTSASTGRRSHTKRQTGDGVEGSYIHRAPRVHTRLTFQVHQPLGVCSAATYPRDSAEQRRVCVFPPRLSTVEI